MGTAVGLLAGDVTILLMWYSLNRAKQIFRCFFDKPKTASNFQIVGVEDTERKNHFVGLSIDDVIFCALRQAAEINSQMFLSAQNSGN